jgi:HPt (histidine-containing phosphotransfer) domain-containing protein
MTQAVGALDVVAADFTGFRRVLDTVGAKELESFHSLSGQYGMFEDVDLLKGRLEQLAAAIDSELKSLDPQTAGTGVAAVMRNVDLLDSLLEQLSRYVTVADLRGAALTSGDLLQKLQGWIATLRDWLTGVTRQLQAIAA